MKRIESFKENTLTVKDNTPVLQVHIQKDAVMLASIPGADNIYAVLDNNLLDKLHKQSRNAKAETLKADGTAGATAELCETLDGVLKVYRMIRDEHYHRIEIEAERDDAEQRLQDAIDAIQNIPSA